MEKLNRQYSKKISANIIRIMGEQGVSISQAKEIGVSKSFMYKLYNGETSISIETLRKFALYLQCNPSDFFKDENNEEISFFI